MTFIKLGNKSIGMEKIIKTKFEVDNTVWFMHNNKACEGIIKKITITVESCIEIKYKVLIKGTFNSKSLLENKIFSSKENLLNSL